ncbi:PadR family transcriptional regulator [Candidatus Bathyarchaeota archaeon]|nr:PadR family transcriptional regulator [Candidatus Bathyarchaeota archaeon]
MRPDIEDITTSNWMKEAQKGYIRVGILILLSKKQSHGYEIMKEIKDKTKGFWRPTAGGVYPVLRSLEKGGYIKGEWTTQNNRKIKTYRITEKGRIILKHAIIKQNEIANNINSLFEEFAKAVLNIEPKNFPIPVMPAPFSEFLEEETRESSEKLTRQKKHLINQIKMLQAELQLINKKIAAQRETNQA